MTQHHLPGLWDLGLPSATTVTLAQSMSNAEPGWRRKKHSRTHPRPSDLPILILFLLYPQPETFSAPILHLPHHA